MKMISTRLSIKVSNSFVDSTWVPKMKKISTRLSIKVSDSFVDSILNPKMKKISTRLSIKVSDSFADSTLGSENEEVIDSFAESTSILKRQSTKRKRTLCPPERQQIYNRDAVWPSKDRLIDVPTIAQRR